MEKIIICLFMIGAALNAHAQDTSSDHHNDTLLLQNIEITSIRASDRAPFTKTDLNSQQIKEKNLGYDLPFLLDQTPSLVSNSDAGNGVGYTNMRIRGSDATRINVTLNGIPYNDAESQGTFFVDMPDIASSVNSIQIQRGVGTSSNGAGAFGATINLSTNEVNKTKYLDFNNSYGSFNTWKNTLRAGTGLLKKHFTVDARVSSITSDGYIDRATSNLKSYYLSAAYLDKNKSFRFNIISGKERTYQAWNGVPESLLKTDRTYNSAGTEKPDAPYANETDNYTQTHYQFFYNQKVSRYLSYNLIGFLTRGKGYYENYKGSQLFSDYGLTDPVEDGNTIATTDLVLQQWLNNYFYGSIFSAQYARGKSHLTLGGGYTGYDGGHYGIVTWAATGFPKDYQNYNTPAYKHDFSIYGKWMQTLGAGISSFVDIQGRFLNYDLKGFNDNPDIRVLRKYAFLNPKAGLSYNRDNTQIYGSLSVGSKEPNRDDYEAGVNEVPKPETLYDWEFGFSKGGKRFHTSVNLYYMDYYNQLVNTGKINDVGAYTRTNAKSSYRAGIELSAAWKPFPFAELSGNIAFSRNKIKNFTEYIDDADSGEQEINNFRNTDISFSPNTVAAGNLTLHIVKKGEVSLISKYVGDQFLDNTSDRGRMLHRYYVQNVRLKYGVSTRVTKAADFIFGINNLFNHLYESNGYTFNYIEGGDLHVENYYFPMAGINFVVGINLSF